MNIELHDRYSATGTPRPDPKTMCIGECEGMGYYPQEKKTLNVDACNATGGKLLIVGQKEKDGKPCLDDNWVFVQCPNCKGTRKKPNK